MELVVTYRDLFWSDVWCKGEHISRVSDQKGISGLYNMLEICHCGLVAWPLGFLSNSPITSAGK